MSAIAELQTSKLGATCRLAACNMDNQKKLLEERIHLLKVTVNGLFFSLCTLLAFEKLILQPVCLNNSG